MNIHEYQAKELFRGFDIPTPKGQVAFEIDEAVRIAQTLGCNDNQSCSPLVVKAQIHAGGRGKGGGVKVVHGLDGVKEAAGQILGMQLVTHQTGPEGRKVKAVLVEEGSNIDRELYISIVVDRGTGMPVIMVSEAGGMDIEEVAEKTPDKIIKEWINPALGVQGFQARKLAYALNIPNEASKEAVKLIENLYRLFWEKDCSLVEINPLVVTKEKTIIALDGKINFDDNAMYRHPDLQLCRDLDEEDPLEVEASKFHLNYIKLDGNVGCMVNGAGLAMATMDIVKLSGAAPANFLDAGGGANKEAIENAFRILISDKSVDAVLINIFGGILRCDNFAEGVVAAASKLDVKLPIVIRMEGTNVERGKQILAESGMKFQVADSMEEAARKVSSAVKTAAVS